MTENKTPNQVIKDIIHDELDNIPYSTMGVITKTYTDGHSDIKTEAYGELTYIQSLAPCNTGDEAVLIFLNNSYEDKIIIPDINTTINELNNRISLLEALNKQEEP